MFYGPICIETDTIQCMRSNFTFKRRFKAKKSEPNKKKNYSLKQSFISKTAHWNYKKLSVFFVTFASLIAVGTLWMWYSNLYMTPERRFWAAIENSMATPSVVRTLSQGGSGNQVVQDYRFHFAPQRAVENVVNYSERSATVNTSIRTEGILFPTEQFLRYTEFTSQSADNESKVQIEELLGQWAREEAENEDEAKLNYLSEQVSVAIFGNFDASFRQEIVHKMKQNNVYDSDFSLALEDKQDDERVILYSVNINLKQYTTLLNESFVRAGYGEFAPLDPENYQDDAMLTATFSVRKRDNSIKRISFGGREESYSNYGVVKQIEVPEASLTTRELQDRVQEIFESR